VEHSQGLSARRGRISTLILLKNPIGPKIDFENDHQNSLAENQNRLYAICERNFSRDFDAHFARV
jgi:hypothetical protein